MIILNSDPIYITINAADYGAFNLSIVRYLRNTSKFISLEYEDIKVNPKTISILNFTKNNPNFIMLIDNDGDGIVDNTTSPNNLTIQGGQTKLETDSDNDSFSDSIDNCPNLYNPNQITDFDGDGFDNLLCGGIDCNDNNPLINPNSIEICNNIDDNCDGIEEDIKEIKIKGNGKFIGDESLGIKGWPINEEWKFKFESEIKPKKGSFKVEGETKFETGKKKDKLKVNGKIEDYNFFLDRYGYGFDLIGDKAKIKYYKIKEELPFMLKISNFNESWQLTHLLGSYGGSVADYGIKDSNDIAPGEIRVKFICKEKKEDNRSDR